MARKKIDPAPMPEPRPVPPKSAAKGTTPTQIRLTPDDLARVDKIVATYGQPSRAAAIRMAVNLIASAIDAGQVPQLIAPKKSAKKSK